MGRFLLVLLLWPLAAASQALDPARLPSQDVRFLQAALVWSGDYVGLTDGEWGARSQDALDAWVARNGADHVPLLMDLAREVSGGGWEVMNLDSGLTVAVPTGLLSLSEERDGSLEFGTPDGSLTFRIFFGTIPEAWAMHQWMLDNDARLEEPYHSVRGDRIVTRTTLGDGRAVYMRSALVDGIMVSMQVLNEPWQQGRAALVASTMQWGRAPDLWPLPGGPIDRLLLAPEPEPVPAPPPAVAAAPRAEPPVGADAGRNAREALSAGLPGTLLGTGSGFYVNNTDVVTAAHVAAECRELRLEDGTALDVLAMDLDLDLAVLSSAQRSANWLPLGPAEGPRLGEPVFVLGYPYTALAAMANQGLSVTGGNVSALPRVADSQSRIMLSAPVQPGNSGGPLLSDDGAVLGVVVARLRDEAVLGLTGTLPQNMNFATSVAQLVPFLEGAGVLFPSAADRPAVDLSQGIPEAVQAAVVLVGCY